MITTRKILLGAGLFAWGLVGTLYALARLLDIDPRSCLYTPPHTLGVRGTSRELKALPEATDGLEGFRLTAAGPIAEPIEEGPTVGRTRLDREVQPVLVGRVIVAVIPQDHELRVQPNGGGPARFTTRVDDVLRLAASRTSAAWVEAAAPDWRVVRRLDLDASPLAERTVGVYAERDQQPREIAIEGRTLAVLVGPNGSDDAKRVELIDPDGRRRSWLVPTDMPTPLLALGTRHLYVLGGAGELGYGRGKLLAIDRGDGTSRTLETPDMCGTVLGVIDDDPVTLESGHCPGEALGIAERKLVRHHGQQGAREVLYAGWTGALWPLQMREGLLLFQEEFTVTGRCERPLGFPPRQHRFVRVTW